MKTTAQNPTAGQLGEGTLALDGADTRLAAIEQTAPVRADFRDGKPKSWRRAALLIAGAAACFHLAYYAPGNTPVFRFMIIGYLICLVQLARTGSTREAFYSGLAAGLICVAPQLECFWRIFGTAAIPLWLVLAFWIAAFTASAHVVLVRLGTARGALLIPVLWTGFEYFRSELYPLRFSWLNVGYAFAGIPEMPFHWVGMYGAGFAAATVAAFFVAWRPARAAVAALLLAALCLAAAMITPKPAGASQIRIAGLQLEFPMEGELPAELDRLIASYPDTDIAVPVNIPWMVRCRTCLKPGAENPGVIWWWAEKIP